MEKETKELQVGVGTQEKGLQIQEPSQVSVSPADMVQILISQGMKPEDLEKMLVLQERYEANQARKAYHVAMTAFKANPPEIYKDKEVSYKDVRYKHASLANVTKLVNEALSKHGLSASWQTAQNGAVSVTCKITHIMGHSEETTLSAQPDASGSKNSIQAICSTITYLQRYTLFSLTGLAAGEDDDGQASEVEYITEDQQANITALIEETKASKEKLLNYMGVQTIGGIDVSDYAKAIQVLESRRKTKEIDVEKEGK